MSGKVRSRDVRGQADPVHAHPVLAHPQTECVRARGSTGGGAIADSRDPIGCPSPEIRLGIAQRNPERRVRRAVQPGMDGIVCVCKGKARAST